MPKSNVGLTFRGKLVAIVAVAAAALGVMTVVNWDISKRVERQMTQLREVYIPLAELGPTLEQQFANLSRGIQDAVAAADLEALAATATLEAGFLTQLAAAAGAVDSEAAVALRTSLHDYYATAVGVARRLITGETGEALVDAMASMQEGQKRVAALVVQVTRLDRSGLAAAFKTTAEDQRTGTSVRMYVSLGCLAAVMVLSIWLGRGVLRSLSDLAAGFERFGRGDFVKPIPVIGRDELAAVAQDANLMAISLGRVEGERRQTDWLKAGQSGLAAELRGDLEPEEAASRAIAFVARHLDAPSAILYVLDQDFVLRALGRYAGVGPGGDREVPSFRVGEGLVGQAALAPDVVVISDPPAGYFHVRSGLGEAPPRAIVLVPLVHGGRVTGVMELALFKTWTALAQEFVVSIRETLAITLGAARARAETQALLEDTQQLASRLAQQDEELQATNDELHAQQEGLRQTNEELTLQAEELELQRRTLQDRNALLDEVRQKLEQKALELTTVSNFKSQFLTNMSHELRTPLNSMLLLSNLLAENEAGNLSEKQVEFSRTIYSAGRDLLALINQVLDLAKVESGKQQIQIEEVVLTDVVERALGVFEPLATDKGLTLTAEIEPELPPTLRTDPQRVGQILTNLLGNAVKFTPAGSIALRIHRAPREARYRRPELRAGSVVALAVSDTGPGIPAEHRERIFAPFEQLDTKIDRRYGGSGLGLSLARELAGLLGGELQVETTLGKGSTFTCYLPGSPTDALLTEAADDPAGDTSISDEGVSDDRDTLGADEPYLLIIEDDPIFASAFGEVIHAYGLKYLHAPDGRTGIRLAKRRVPTGIILDVRLPDLDGFAVMDQLRADPMTASVPVHFASALDAPERGIPAGAVGYLMKPAVRGDLVRVVESLAPQHVGRAEQILVVEDDAVTGESLLKLLAADELKARRVGSAREALLALRQEPFGCMILDLSLPDMDGLDLLRLVEEQCGSAMPSVVIYTARAMSKAEAKRLEAYTQAVVLKEGASVERVLNEARLFVRRLQEGLAPRRQTPVQPVPAQIKLEGRRVLVVDDDMRTVYALSATLRAKGMEVLVAENGREALTTLDTYPGIEIVLMDIMMPEMDGYEAMRTIRRDPRFAELPIVALTAKAMKGEIEKCLEAGATDYLPKPIEAHRLLTLMNARLNAV